MTPMDAREPVTSAASGVPIALPVTEGPVAFVISAHVRPGLEDAFLDLLTPVLDAMRDEPYFINAVLHRDPEDASHFMLYETWADLGDVMEVQLNRDYRREFLRRLPDMLAGEREMQIWTPLRSDFVA